ncbi:hypothetical protein X975_06545, partial [Stegodyphus mimosarum]
MIAVDVPAEHIVAFLHQLFVFLYPEQVQDIHTEAVSVASLFENVQLFLLKC